MNGPAGGYGASKRRRRRRRRSVEASGANSRPWFRIWMYIAYARACVNIVYRMYRLCIHCGSLPFLEGDNVYKRFRPPGWRKQRVCTIHSWIDRVSLFSSLLSRDLQVGFSSSLLSIIIYCLWTTLIVWKYIDADGVFCKSI